MSSPLQDLRRQLREQFPQAHPSRPKASASVHPGLPSFPKGALSELSPATPASSLSLLLAHLLQSPDESAAAQKHPVPSPRDTPSTPSPDPRPPSSPSLALIDGRDSFDPTSYGPAACARLLWVRCRQADEALRCADLLLRDGNLPLLLLDLRLNPTAELDTIPTSSWYRLRNLAAQSGSTLLALTARPLIPAAALQLTATHSFHLPDLESPDNLADRFQTTNQWTDSGKRKLS